MVEGASVMRTCAPIAINDCKTANSVQYCYCKDSACNSPDPLLAPVGQQGREGKVVGERRRGEGEGERRRGEGMERKALGSTSAAHSPPAFASQFQGGHFPDDEVTPLKLSLKLDSFVIVTTLVPPHVTNARTWRRGALVGATSTTTSTTTGRSWRGWWTARRGRAAITWRT